MAHGRTQAGEKLRHAEGLGDVVVRPEIERLDLAGLVVAARQHHDGQVGILSPHGAQKVVAYCTHPVLSGAAIDNITRSQLDELVVTDTIPLAAAARACSRIRQLSVAEMLAETIRRIAFGESVSSLYLD